MSASYDTLREKNESFDIKNWVTGGTKIRPGKVGKWSIFESNWLNNESQIGSTLRVKLAQHWESNWLNIESLIDSTLRVKLAQHWESNWLNIESQIGSTLRVKLTQHCESNWLNIASQIGSTCLIQGENSGARDGRFVKQNSCHCDGLLIPVVSGACRDTYSVQKFVLALQRVNVISNVVAVKDRYRSKLDLWNCYFYSYISIHLMENTSNRR